MTYASPGNVAPFFLAFEDSGISRGVMAYVFTANRRNVKNRPSDEHRLQVRYGDVNSQAWRALDHEIGFDPARMDTTMVLGVDVDAEVVVALDPLLYNPLPLGISVFWKASEVQKVNAMGWHAWQRDNHAGAVRGIRSDGFGIETLVGVKPKRFLDLVRLEQQSFALQLDPPLRLNAALALAKRSPQKSPAHRLEKAFSLPANVILDIVEQRSRLAVAVVGGVAEYHLEQALRNTKLVTQCRPGTVDGPPDFVTRVKHRKGEITIECKNAAKGTYADGSYKVEVQKTRASKNDPSSRFYEVKAFDVIAACLFSPTGKWEFRYKRSDRLERHPNWPTRIKPMQRVDSSWSTDLPSALQEENVTK